MAALESRRAGLRRPGWRHPRRARSGTRDAPPRPRPAGRCPSPTCDMCHTPPTRCSCVLIGRMSRVLKNPVRGESTRSESELRHRCPSAESNGPKALHHPDRVPHLRHGSGSPIRAGPVVPGHAVSFHDIRQQARDLLLQRLQVRRGLLARASGTCGSTSRAMCASTSSLSGTVSGSRLPSADSTALRAAADSFTPAGRLGSPQLLPRHSSESADGRFLTTPEGRYDAPLVRKGCARLYLALSF